MAEVVEGIIELMVSNNGKISDSGRMETVQSGQSRLGHEDSCGRVECLESERDALVKRNDLLDTVFYGIPDPLFIVDENLTILGMNHAASTYFNASANDVTGRKCLEALTNRCSACHGCSIVDLVKKREAASFEREGCIDPHNFEQVDIFPVSLQGGKNGVIVHVSDITEKKMLQREMLEADKMISLGVLVAGVAHEINNPNNFIMLNAPTLKEAWQSIIPILENHFRENGDFSVAGLPYSEVKEDIFRLFVGIEEGSKRIKGIVRNLKEYARKDSSDMTQTVDLKLVIEKAVALTRNLLKKSTGRFSVECDQPLPPITGNSQRLEQVFINLIQNACQSLPDKEKGITVKAFANKDGIVIEVADEGIGISEKDQRRIMDPFFTTKRTLGGTGLGLSVSLNIVKEHKGTLNVSSEKGQGSVFSVFLPVKHSEKQYKILVVDDDTEVRKMISLGLKREGRYLVQEAANGSEAFFNLGMNLPHLLILDIHMPDMDGVEVCRLLKSKTAFQNISVLVITASSKSTEVEDIRELGFKAILFKPFTMQELMTSVENCLKTKGDADEG